MNTDQIIQSAGPAAIRVASEMLPLPLPAAPITVRAGTLDDVSFMDGLQKKHTKQVGWMPTKTLEGKIKLGRIRAGDTSTPWWFPSQTTGGSIREDRIVLADPAWDALERGEADLAAGGSWES